MKIIKVMASLAGVLLVCLAVLLAVFDGNWLKPAISRLAAEQTGRTLTIDGDLEFKLLRSAPLLIAEGIRFENASWADQPSMLELARLEVSVDLWALLRGELILPQVVLTQPRLWLQRGADGRANWTFSGHAVEAEKPVDDGTEDDTTDGVWLPQVRRLSIRDGKTHYLDRSLDTEIEATVSGGQRTELDARGRLAGQPLSLSLRAGPLADLQQGTEPYPLWLYLDAGETNARIEGMLIQPLQLRGVDLSVTLQGEGAPALAKLAGVETPALPAYRLDAKLRRNQGQGYWRIDDIDARFGASDVRGSARIDPDAQPLTASAELQSEHIDIDQLGEIFTGDQPAQEPTVIDFALLRRLSLQLMLQLEELKLNPSLTLHDLTAQLELQQGQLAVEPLRLAFGGGAANLQVDVDIGSPLHGQARLDLERLNPALLAAAKPPLTPAATPAARVDGYIDFRLQPIPAAQGQVTLSELLAHLRLAAADLGYRDPAANTELSVVADDADDALALRLEGRLQGQELQARLQTDPLAGLLAGDGGTPVALNGEMRFAGLEGGLQARLGRSVEGWKLAQIDAGLGDSRVRGSMALNTAGTRPELVAELHSKKLALSQLAALGGATQTTPDAADAGTADDGDGVPGLSVLGGFDADVELQVDEIDGPVPVEDVALQLALNDGRLKIEPLRARVAGNELALSGRLDIAAAPASGAFTLDFGTVNLARTAAALGVAEPPPGELSGQLQFIVTGEPAAGVDELALPGLGRLTLAPSRLRYRAAQQQTEIEVTVQTVDGEAGAQPLRIEAAGRYRGEALRLRASGGPPLALRDPAKPYDLDGTLNIADTELRLAGRIGRPLAFRDLDLEFSAAGPSPARLSALVGAPLPDLPPYRVAGNLGRDGEQWLLRRVNGRVGDSDIGGDIRIAPGDEPPTLYANIISRRLDLDDLAGLVGARPDPDETASARQRREAKARERRPNLLPREGIGLGRLSRAVNGVIRFKGERIQAPKLPIDDLSVELKISDGRVTLAPLDFGIGGGNVRSRLEFDTGKPQIEGVVEGEVSRVSLRQALAPFEVADDSLGIVGGRLKFWVKGDSVAEYLASADGGLFLLMTDGRLDTLLTELAGLDLGETLAVLFGDPKAQTPIDCAYLDVLVEGGRLGVNTFVIDTSDTLFLADGEVDLARERLDLIIEPHPKDWSLFSARSSVSIGGTFKEPSVTPGEELYAKLGAAAILSAAATPVAGLLPLIELGDGEESPYCNGLIGSLDAARKKSESESGAGSKSAPTAEQKSE